MIALALFLWLMCSLIPMNKVAISFDIIESAGKPTKGRLAPAGALAQAKTKSARLKKSKREFEIDLNKPLSQNFSNQLNLILSQNRTTLNPLIRTKALDLKEANRSLANKTSFWVFFACFRSG